MISAHPTPGKAYNVSQPSVVFTMGLDRGATTSPTWTVEEHVGDRKAPAAPRREVWGKQVGSRKATAAHWAPPADSAPGRTNQGAEGERRYRPARADETL